MRACSPASPLVLSRLAPIAARIERASRSTSSSSTTSRRNLAFAASTMSSSSLPQPPPRPFDGSARRGGLLHPRFQDPSPSPPKGEEVPPVRQAQQRCSRCGGALSVAWLEGRWRHACIGAGGGGGRSGCGTIAYTNPLLVVGAIITDADVFTGGTSSSSSSGSESGSSKARTATRTTREPKVLLCKRAIEPRKGCWTLPAGYLELGESAAAGAARETWEEARARVEIFGPYFHADVPAIGQTYLLFRGKLVSNGGGGSGGGGDGDEEGMHTPPDFSSGPESEEVALFPLHEIPKLDLAFSAVATALRLFAEDVERHGFFHYHHGTILKQPGGPPNAGTLVDHFALPIRNN